MHKILAALTAMALAGCATGVVSTTPRQVIVKMGHAYPAEATKLAQAECEKNGRSARLNQRDPDAPLWYFDCL